MNRVENTPKESKDVASVRGLAIVIRIVMKNVALPVFYIIFSMESADLSPGFTLDLTR